MLGEEGEAGGVETEKRELVVRGVCELATEGEGESGARSG